MPIKIGSADIDDVKLGSTNVEKIYVGTNLVWQRVIPPTLSAIPNQSLSYNANANININAYVSGDSPITITASGLPSGLSIGRGFITGQSTASGTHTVTVTATNSGGTDSRTFTITIATVSITAQWSINRRQIAGSPSYDVTVTTNGRVNAMTVSSSTTRISDGNNVLSSDFTRLQIGGRLRVNFRFNGESAVVRASITLDGLTVTRSSPSFTV